jgi:hypothetical protein
MLEQRFGNHPHSKAFPYPRTILPGAFCCLGFVGTFTFLTQILGAGHVEVGIRFCPITVPILISGQPVQADGGTGLILNHLAPMIQVFIRFPPLVF